MPGGQTDRAVCIYIHIRNFRKSSTLTSWECRLWNAVRENAVRRSGRSSSGGSATGLPVGRVGAHVEVGHGGRRQGGWLPGAVEAMRYLRCQRRHGVHVGGCRSGSCGSGGHQSGLLLLLQVRRLRGIRDEGGGVVDLPERRPRTDWTD